MIVFETLADAIRAQLAAAGVAGGNVERDRNEPTTEFELPCCQVMVASDRAVPDGDPRTGLPRFEHTLTIAAIAYDRADTGLALKGKLAAHAEAILSSLLGNLAWQGNVVEGLAGLPDLRVAARRRGNQRARAGAGRRDVAFVVAAACAAGRFRECVRRGRGAIGHAAARHRHRRSHHLKETATCAST